MDYIEWNNLIGKHFFNETNSGREVFLYVNDDVLNEIGQETNCDVNDFIESIKMGPSWLDLERFEICDKAFHIYYNWRLKGSLDSYFNQTGLDFSYPTYIGYLAFFVLAAVTETDFGSNSYYPGFWKRLGMKQDLGTPARFHKMRELWEDLETWSREEKREELGRFVVRVRGGFSHVGIPWSQTLLSENECKLLPNFFERADLDPTDPPSLEVLCKFLGIYGDDILQRRTKRLFEDYQKNIDLRMALAQYILDELEDWDGTVDFRIQETDARPGTQAGLRICLKLDNVAGKIITYLRFKTPKMYPPDGLEFRISGDDRVWACNEESGGWSQPLRCLDSIPPSKLDASLFDWTKGVQLSDNENHWRARLRGSNTRLFLLRIDMLPDWVETQRLERGLDFIVATYRNDTDFVRNWGKDYCDHFQEFDYDGLPTGWKIFQGKNAKTSCNGIDVLTISTSARINLKGGIKANRALHFFYFAPPLIYIQNSVGNERVFLNGKQLKRDEINKPIYQIPQDTPTNIPIRIKLETEEQYQRKNLWLVDYDMPSSFGTPAKNSEGLILRDKSRSECACGAVVTSNNKIEPYPNLLPFHLSHRIIFIGERPGEIIDWPHEEVNEKFQPVWAIAVKGRKKWKIHFCGNEGQAKSEHKPGKPISDKNNVKKWKNAIWTNRRKMKKPDLPVLRMIWEKYEGVARNV
jgi:hypothetical protein